MTTKDLGMVTAYAYAVVGGYEGTEADFEALLGNIATDLEEIENLTVVANTLPEGSSATASYADGVLTLGIPKGDTGATGAGATATVGTTTTGNPGTNASVINSGTAKDAVFNFTIPRGDTGNGIESIYLTGTSGAVKTYTILFTNGNTTTFDVTDGEVTNASLATILEDYAKIDGAYEQMTVGNAEQLISSVTVNDKVPYNFRTSGGSIDIGNREVDKLVGGTVAWNQLINPSGLPATATKNGVTFTNNGDGTITLSGTADATFTQAVTGNFPMIQGHKYFVYSPNLSSNLRLYDGFSQDGFAMEGGGIIYFNRATNNQTKLYAYVVDGATFSSLTIKVMCIDLTQMFGSTIADYIYSLETATAGAGVAWFKKLFPKDYYVYNAGQLMSVKTSAHQMVGFNACEDFIVNAQANPYVPVLFAKGELLPNTDYCISFEGAEGNYVYGNENLFDYKSITVTSGRTYTVLHTKNVVSKKNTLQWDVNRNAWIILKNNGTNAVTPSFTDVCINLSWDGERDGDYEAYKKWTYPLDSDLELRGIPKLDASNNLYYDGDEYESDGTVTRRYAVKNLGDLTYTYNTDGTYPYMRAYISDAKTGVNNVAGNLISSVGVTVKAADIRNNGVQGIAIDDQKLVRIITANMGTDPTAFKTAMDGVYLVYELATPTTEEADPYQNPQIVDDFGTEEYVDERTVAIPVGHDTEYMNNLKAKLEMAPDSPDGDGDYIVRQTNGENSYVPLMKELPSLPSTDGTYTLKCTVASGTATLGWVEEE